MGGKGGGGSVPGSLSIGGPDPKMTFSYFVSIFSNIDLENYRFNLKILTLSIDETYSTD